MERLFTPALRLTSGSAVVLAGLWLLEIGGLFENHGIARAVTAIAVLSLTALLIATGAKLARAPAGPERGRNLALAASLTVALVLRFTGLDFELLTAPIGDEGVFHEVAQEINDGKPFPETFNYGHVLYYAGAFAIWFYELFPTELTRFLELFYTTEQGYGVQRILLYGVNALLSALAVGAAFGAGYRLAGRLGAGPSGRRLDPLWGAVGAASLLAFSPLYNSVAHELIADVPAAAFAAFTLYFVARLLERETTTDYLLAGVSAGLAAGSKYPGGVVAVAIIAVWLYWRLKLRTWSWSLLWAGLISIATLIATMPALFVRPEVAFGGKGLDIFFGFRQYARGGWIGVQPESNLLWYGSELLRTFGWPAAGLAAIGTFLLDRDQRRRWLVMAAYPAVYLTLIFSMSMVVRRNLQVVLPALAILIGTAGAAVICRLGKRRFLAVAVAALGLALPVWGTVSWSISQTRSGTRQLAAQWIAANVPEGASIVRERYTPPLDEETHELASVRFAAWIDPAEMLSGKWDFLILARPSYGRFVDAESFRRDHQEELRDRYLDLLSLPKVAEFRPGALTAGPLLSIHALEEENPRFLNEREFHSSEATFLSHPDLARDGPGRPLQYTRRWQFSVFKEFLAAGTYVVELGTNPPPAEGYLHVVDRFNREVGTFDILSDFTVTLPADEKYLLRVFLAPPTRLYGVKVSPAG